MKKVELKSFARNVWYRDDEVKLVIGHLEFFTYYKYTYDDMPWLCVKSITVEVTTNIIET